MKIINYVSTHLLNGIRKIRLNESLGDGNQLESFWVPGL